MDREAIEKLISEANSLTSSNSRKFSSKSKTSESLNREKRAPTAFHSFDDGEDGVERIDSVASLADSGDTLGGSTPVSVPNVSQKSAINPSPMTPPTILGGGELKETFQVLAQ